MAGSAWPNNSSTVFRSSNEGRKPSGHFRLDRPPEFTHPANRPRLPGLGGSQLILLISDATHEGPRFPANPRFRTQTSDDRRDIQLMQLGELPRPELVIRVVPGTVVPLAQGNGGQIGGLLAQAVRPGMGRLDSTCRVAHGARKCPDPLQVSGMADSFDLY